jgi:hypothetical protein
MRVNAITGFKMLIGFGPKINAAVEAKPDRLLLHENLMFRFGISTILAGVRRRLRPACSPAQRKAANGMYTLNFVLTIGVHRRICHYCLTIL